MSQLKLPSVDSFFEKTKAHVAIPKLEALLESLENKDSCASACKTLHELALALETSSDGQLFLQKVPVPGLDEPIKLILHAAVFSPEYWGRTFAEGLLKDPEIFHGKQVVELGTGSGWISLLLLHRTGVHNILGLDINPVAIVIANINKWLNGTKPDGSLVLSQAGVPIVKAFRAEVSDLLEKPLGRGEKFDHIIGCIPQVLHPVQTKSDANADKLSYQDLYDLSNYCFNQGILEDRYGLPLISRALEEAQLCMNPQGLLTLILGGRPGQAAIEQMFKRRGYEPKLWWVRRIQQADDTDLAQLVNLENAYGIKFHFFISDSSKHSVPASTAVELQEHGQKVFHDLLIYQASTNHEKPTIEFVRNLHALGLDSLRKELDFSRISEEQISFLDRLTADLLQSKMLPYPHERGDLRFRKKLAKFLLVYCHYSVSAAELFVGPERAQMLSMILSMVSESGDSILLSASLENNYSDLLKRRGLNVISGNDDLSEVLELDTVFKPKISLLSPYQLGDPSPLLLQALIQQAEAHPDRWYLIDDSQQFDIGSAIQSNFLMRLIGQRKLPANLIFLYGLVKNTVCPDFELSFLINAPKQWVDGLEVCAELSYSRISYVVQLYYEWLFDELLSFPFADAEVEKEKELSGTAQLPLGTFRELAADPVFMPKPVDTESSSVIRMDYGEFEYSIPTLLVKGLLKGFLEPSTDGMADVLDSRISAYIKKTRLSQVDNSRLVIGQGVFPLLGALLSAFKERLGRAPVVAMPRSSYGPLYPMLKYYGAELQLIETSEADAFLLKAEQIAKLPQKPDILWLSQPSNPTGIYMEAEQIRQLMSLCAERGIYVFADEIFFLLSDAKLGTWTPANLSFANVCGEKEAKWLFYADGLSKSFAAGGLRCGFMVCPDQAWAKSVRRFCSLPPQSTLRAWDTLYSTFLEESPHQLIDVRKEFAELEKYLLGARQLLSEQRNRLLELLSKYKLADELPEAKRGGLFVLARLDEEAEAIAKEEKLLLNPGSWGRMEPWARISFGLQPEQFDKGFARLAAYLHTKF